MVVLNYKFKSHPLLSKNKVYIWLAVAALTVSIAFGLEDIVRGAKDVIQDVGIHQTKVLRI
ncbi:MAG: hypothetical protein WD059_02660 [Balneolaceae bacterium]